jgi:hypothetical protein
MNEPHNSQKIVWLASYPKSGNTWLRAFLANLRSERDEPVDINNLGGGPIASARPLFDEAMGIEASDLTTAEIAHYRPAVYEHLTTSNENILFLKIHDAFTSIDTGQPIISRAATKSVIYIIRNPLDVVVSYAHHMNVSLERATRLMGKHKHALESSQRGMGHQLRQQLLTWSEHVQSWVDDSDLPLLVIRYEDMVQHPVETFTTAARFVELSDDPEQIERAIAFSSFDVLQSQEREHGFGEKPLKADAFFRQGKVGGWREALSEEHVAKIVQDHGQMMHRFGYLTDTEMIVY